jgi:hypothetical protein
MPYVGAVAFRFAAMGRAFTLLFIALATVASLAQDKPLAEVTGSYQFERLTLSVGGASGRTNFSRGWDGSVEVPITRWFGVVGDVGRVWKTETALLGTLPASATASSTLTAEVFN